MFSEYLGIYEDKAFVVTDFDAGAGGDLLDFTIYGDMNFPGPIQASAEYGGYTGGNPFDPLLGYLRLYQSGDDTLLQWDLDGMACSTYDWVIQLTLQNVDKDTITSDNFVGQLVVGTAGDDSLVGGASATTPSRALLVTTRSTAGRATTA